MDNLQMTKAMVSPRKRTETFALLNGALHQRIPNCFKLSEPRSFDPSPRGGFRINAFEKRLGICTDGWIVQIVQRFNQGWNIKRSLFVLIEEFIQSKCGAEPDIVVRVLHAE